MAKVKKNQEIPASIKTNVDARRRTRRAKSVTQLKPSERNEVVKSGNFFDKNNIIGKPEKSHRYFYVTYRYVYLNVERVQCVFIETQYNRHFSIKDVAKTIGIDVFVIEGWKEFENEKDYKTFQGIDTVKIVVEDVEEEKTLPVFDI